jgi:hypothetical protein
MGTPRERRRRRTKTIEIGQWRFAILILCARQQGIMCMETVILMQEVEIEMVSVRQGLDHGASNFRDQRHSGVDAISACKHEEAGSGWA